MGDRARGLQRERRRLGRPAPRPGPVQGLPVERRRSRGAERRRPAPVLRLCLLERRRSDPQGADLRAHRQRGQPRRGRQGALVVPRRHARPLLDALALLVPTARVPLRRPHRREPAPQSARPRVRAARHGHLRRGPLLGRHRRLRQGGPGRRLHPAVGAQRRTGRGHRPRPPDRLVPQHVVVGPRRPQAGAVGEGRVDRHGAQRARSDGPGRRRPADGRGLRERVQRRTPLGHGRVDPVPQGRDR